MAKACAKNEKINIGVVGLGARGSFLLDLLLQMPDVNVVAVSDLYKDRIEAGQKAAEKLGLATPKGFEDYRHILDLKGIDALITPSSWQSHVRICLDSMDAGIYVATEVGGATSLHECWQLVDKYEATKVPCMMLENCCYGREEMTILKMVRMGLFGQLLHCEGGYCHDLREEICMGAEKRHYRLENFRHRNGEIYPTHELGPIAKYLGINRGNRMVSLVAMASKALGLNAWAKEHRGEKDPLATARFNEGDVVTTMIKCANGETIYLKHGCSLPRPYSRMNVVEGTKGIWMEDKHSISIEGITKKSKQEWDPETWEDLNDYYAKYEHPLWVKYRKTGIMGGHGGMDGLVLRAFLTAVRNKTQTPIDVYDTAAWMAVTPLSEESIAKGSMPVDVPDFTHGDWMNPRPVVSGPYCLDEDKPVKAII